MVVTLQWPCEGSSRPEAGLWPDGGDMSRAAVTNLLASLFLLPARCEKLGGLAATGTRFPAADRAGFAASCLFIAVVDAAPANGDLRRFGDALAATEQFAKLDCAALVLQLGGPSKELILYWERNSTRPEDYLGGSGRHHWPATAR